MRFTEMSYAEAFTHHRHGGFRLELFGRDIAQLLAGSLDGHGSLIGRTAIG